MERIQEKNRLIAEFMGYKYESWVTLGGSPGRFFNVQNRKDSFPEAKYHTSWDWLKPVLKKLYDLFSEKAIPLDNLPDYHADTDNSWKKWSEHSSWVYTASAQFDINKTYESVCHLIQWYNTQTP